MKLIDQILRKPLYVAFGQALQGGGITSIDLVAIRDATTVTMTASDGSAAPIAGADASTAGVMTAADKTKLDGLPTAKARDFTTKLDAATSMIGAGITHLRTAGHAAAGDGGGALYKRVASPPSHALKVQSLDGAWWELVPDHGYINVKQAGAVGDNVTDDGQSFVDALAFASLNANVNDNATYGVIVPPSVTPYYLGANTLELKRTVHLVGQNSGLAGGVATVLRWDANITGIIVHRTNTIGATTEVDPAMLGADASKIEGLQLTSGGGTIAGVTDATKGHAIWLRARAVITDVTINAFPGNGINIVAGAGAGGALEGNANNWAIERVRVTNCHMSGIFVDLADVNAGYCLGADCSSNGRWGIYDSSFLGNTYVACHTANNGLATIGENGAGASSLVEFGGNLYAANVAASEAQLVATTPGTDETVWFLIGAGSSSSTVPTWLAAQSEGTYFLGGPYRTDNANARNVFTGCYVESGQGPSQFVAPTIAFGGLLSTVKGSAVVHKEASIVGSLSFPNHQTNNFAPARDLTLQINPSPDKLLKVMVSGDHASGMNILAWDEVSGHLLIGEHANSGLRRPINLTTDLNSTTHGRASAQTGGELYLYKGFWIGGGAGQARHFAGFRSKPTSGDAARGDKWWNFSPLTQGDPAGWRVTTAGTIGSGAILEEYFYLPDLPGDHPGYNIRPKVDGANRVQWREAAKAGTDTIADTANTVAVAFTTVLASANYSVALAADGDERVWVTLKTASGFTLNRLATSGARTIDWTATPHEDL